MKTWKLLAGALLVLVGFCAGVGWNFSLSPTVHGAGTPPDPPPAALKSIAHDATLAGNGTDATPLGISNGGVSAPKLSTSATPSAGQVLGFNGANLAWQNAPVGGVRVVDKFGQFVGVLFNPSGAIRQVGAFPLTVLVGVSGFQSGAFSFYHTSTDCSAPRYYPASAGMLRGSSTTVNQQLIYPADPLQQITARSFERIGDTADPNQPGTCTQPSTPLTAIVGLATSFDLSTLNLTPPFHLEF